MTAFLAPELGDPVENKVLQRRAFKFDLDVLEKEYAQKDQVIDESIALALKVAKPPLQDPDIFALPDDGGIKL